MASSWIGLPDGYLGCRSKAIVIPSRADQIRAIWGDLIFLTPP
jgi:hypothetical protein